MNKAITVSILALAFIGGFYVFYNPKSVSNPTQKSSSASNAQQKWETKTDEQSEITVTVTPIDISPESKEWRFNVVMDTHSVELDQDLLKITVLVDDRGKEYKPLNWEGAPAGGHHREGVLTFNQITPLPKFIEIKISDVGGVMRSFMWQLKTI